MSTARPSLRALAARARRTPAARLAHWLPVVVLALAVALAVRPLFTVTFPVTHDGLNHLQRQVAFDALLRAGVLVPRWYPDFASGYGYPLGNFYPPLALYVAEAPLLAGAGPTGALKGVFVLALALAAGGACLFIRRAVGTVAAGVLGGTAYLAAPYLLATVYDRGALPEALALGLLPWCLWAVDRWRGGREGFPLLVLLLAAVMATHSIVAAVAWVLCAVWWTANRRGSLQRLPLAFGAAAGLSAYLWLPAAVEAPEVSLDNFARLGIAALNVVPLGSLVDAGVLYDHGTFPYRLGLVQTGLALVGALIALPSPACRRPAVTAFVLFLGCALATTSLVSPVWAHPAVQGVQFPWRLLGPASLFAALLVGALAARDRGWVVAGVGVPVLLAGGLAGLQPADRQVDDSLLSVGSAVRREWTEGTIGTTTAAEYLPAVARAGYAPGPLPADSARDAAPLTAARLEAWTPLGWRLRIEAAEPTVLRLHQFAFPGWAAWVDGAPVPVVPDGPLGLATIAVPTGEHLVEIRFTTTLPRVLGALLSGLTAIVLGWLVAPVVSPVLAAAVFLVGLALASLPVPRASTLASADLGGVQLVGGTTEARDGRVVATLVWLGTRPGGERLSVRLRDERGIVLAESVAYPGWNTATRWSTNELLIDRRDLSLPAGPARRAVLEVAGGGQSARVGTIDLPVSSERTRPPLANRIEARFGSQLALTGWAVTGLGPDRSLFPGQPIEVTLEWTALRSVDEDYTVFVHLMGPDGQRYGQTDSQPAAGLAPTTLLLPGEPLRDRRLVPVAADAPPGRYRLEVGLYLLSSGERLAVDGGTSVALGPFKVPSAPLVLPAVDPLEAPFGPVSLLGARADATTLTLVWRAVERPPVDLNVAVHLLDAGGRLVAQADGPPDGGRYPTSLWSSGETIVDRRPLPLVSADRLAIWLYDPVSGERSGEPATLPLPPREDAP